ncbi:DUF695 domain-containing protein [Carboxylicivirga sp. RSCT41]|uniref:DUF695 domain-containing protein n=1 Tax=Carboxylicivirga agarovorans TaxID=3417570 RepID=UPI003D34301E
MNRLLLITLIFSFLTLMTSKAQEGNWDVYMAQYEKGAGSIALNMDLIGIAPNKTLPFILITGVKFDNCREDGFPNSDEFEKLYNVSDNIENLIKENVAYELAGTFTYQCERLDYIYLSDTISIRKKLIELYTSKFGNYEYFINLKPDNSWKAYKEFLYPNEITQEYMSNQKVLFQLQKAGDNLSKQRQVDHWIYFSQESNKEEFKKYVESLGFKVEGQQNDKNFELPYQLHISRIDYIYPESINKITLELRKKAKDLNGDYDGWETFVITE